MSSRLRVSAISFLNTAPLMWGFDHEDLRQQFEVHYTLPAACAQAVRMGVADIGIIPVIAYQTIPDLAIIPGVSIAAKGPVRSILLISKKPIAEVKTVAADSSSRTSVALCRVLMRKWFGGQRVFTAMAPNLPTMLAEADAALIIGDPALTIDRSQYKCYDLAEEWTNHTGKPFVFAFWAVRKAALEGVKLDLPRIFQTSRDHGLEPENVEKLAREWAPRVGISEASVKSYLTENIDYSLGNEQVEGMKLFFDYAVETGVIPAVKPFEFLTSSEKGLASAIGTFGWIAAMGSILNTLA
jgi:chorismate dehydratase